MNAPPSLAKLPSRREEAVQIIQRLRQCGHIAFLAGGCVRDELLGLAPKDFDVATDAPPPRVREIFSRTQAVGAAFGVVLVSAGASVIEVATFRRDGEYTDHRRPDNIEFASPEQDAQRRDFTINGLFLDPIDGRIIDYVGGQADLAARLLRAIGEPAKRFAEDYLRLLRAVRFAARFSLAIDAATTAAIQRYAARLAEISPERIADELRGILTAPSRAIGWSLLRSFGLADVIFRFTAANDAKLAPVDDQEAASSAVGSASILAALPATEVINFPLALAAAALDSRQTQSPAATLCEFPDARAFDVIVRGLRKSLRLSNEETDDLAAILSAARLLDDVSSLTLARLKRFMAAATFADARRLLVAISEVAAVPSNQRTMIGALLQRFDALAGVEVAPPPLVMGDDLIAAGLQPGPLFKRILDRTYDEQLEGRLASRDVALAFALKIAGD